MSYSVNKVTLLGNVGKDPEFKIFSSGSCNIKFSIATSEKYKNKNDETVEQTEWHNVEIWNKLAEIANKYLHKGDKVYIEGKLKTESYEKDGITRYLTKIIASDLVLIGAKGENSASSQPKRNDNYIPKEEPVPEHLNLTQEDYDDVPF